MELGEAGKYGDSDTGKSNGGGSDSIVCSIGFQDREESGSKPNKMELGEAGKYGDLDTGKSNGGGSDSIENKFSGSNSYLTKLRGPGNYRMNREYWDYFEYLKNKTFLSPFVWYFDTSENWERFVDESSDDKPVVKDKPRVNKLMYDLMMKKVQAAVKSDEPVVKDQSSVHGVGDNLMDRLRTPREMTESRCSKQYLNMEKLLPKKSRKRSLFHSRIVTVEDFSSKNDVESAASSSSTAIKESFPDNGPPKKESKLKKNVMFSDVTIYYFKRIQGFVSVPLRGGCTLGMENKHNHMEVLSISEHAEGKKCVLKKSLANHRRVAKFKSVASDCDDNEDSDVETDSETASDTAGILKALPVQQRRALLQASGVKVIDSFEEEECKEIRNSRKLCGCQCKDACDPDSCSCSQNGIKCQIDVKDFPCKCNSDCKNIAGRIEYINGKVTAHFSNVISNLNNM